MRSRHRGGARPAGRSHQRPCRHLLRLRRDPCRFRRSVLPDVAVRGHRPARRGRRRHHGGDPGAAIFHQGRKPVVRLRRLQPGQHDRLSGGRAGPGTRNMLCGNRFGYRSGCRYHSGRGCEGHGRIHPIRKEHGAVQGAGAGGDRQSRRRPQLHALYGAHRRRIAGRVAVRLLVTGAAGFIGSRVHSALRAAGHEVIAVDALLPTAHGPNSVLPPGCRKVDVRDADALAPLLDGVDLVCHQAAMVGAGVDAADAPAYGSHNDFATTVLLARMFAAGVRRLVLASSMVVYGQGHYACPDHGLIDPLPRRRADLDAGIFEHRCPVCGLDVTWLLVDEDAALRPRSLYAASKAAQEHYALAWSEATDGWVVALRYHNVYGPGMPRDTPYSGVAAIFRSSLEKGEPPRVFEDGAQMRDFVHVDDVAAANLAATSAASSASDGFIAVNVCSGRPISIREVATALCEIG